MFFIDIAIRTLLGNGGEGEKMERTYGYTRGIPIEAQYLFWKAMEFSHREKYETALRYFRQVVILAPRFSRAYAEMGDCLEKLGRYYEAVVVYDRALSIDPLNAEAQAKRDQVIKVKALDNTGIPLSERQPVSRRNNIL